VAEAASRLAPRRYSPAEMIHQLAAAVGTNGLIGGQALGRRGPRPVELQTADGKFALRNADIEVKTLPKTADAPAAPTLVKLNIGEARLGDIALTKEAVQGVVGGKFLDRTIAIGEIALPTPRRDAAPAKTGDATTPAVRQPFIALPVANLPTTEFKPLAEPVKISTAIISPNSLQIESVTLSKTALSTLLVSDPAQTIKPYSVPVDSAMLVSAYPIPTATGSTSLNTISKQLQDVQKTTSVSTSTSTTTITAPLTQQVIFQAPTQTTTTLTSPVFSPKFTLTR